MTGKQPLARIQLAATMDGGLKAIHMKRGDQASHSAARDSVSAPRAALYMRVSTGRQAEHDLSIPINAVNWRLGATPKGIRCLRSSSRAALLPAMTADQSSSR
jgi:hypothetical protein